MTSLQHFLRRIRIVLFLSFIILPASQLWAQASSSKKQILVDIAHGQKFYNDPSDMQGKDPALIERVKYMQGELVKNANSLNAEVAFLKSKLTADALANCDLLFIHIPSASYDGAEVKAIQDYIQKGGALFLVMEVDYWASLAQANVNDILKPFGIVFKTDNPDTKSSGGYSKVSTVTGKQHRIPYHGARIVEGGTPFCFSNQTEDYPFGVYKQVGKGGKIIAMGDGMVSLYMTSWEGVSNYQCSEFMQDAFTWLLK